MTDYLASAREAQFRGHKPEQLTDQEPVFLLVPATQNDVYHFAAKHSVKATYGNDLLFCLGACVGVTYAPVVCGVIQVGRPIQRNVGDVYVCEVWNCCHDIVPGIRAWLYGRAIHAARALGFQTMLDRAKEPALLESLGFTAAQRVSRNWKGFALDLTRLPEAPIHEGHERIALPEKPPLDCIDLP